MAKLRSLLDEIFEQHEAPLDRRAVVEGVSQYGNVGKKLYSEHNIMEIAEQLVKIAESAQSHVLSETDDWFDKVSVNRNMKAMTGMVKEFKTTATEYNSLSERLVALYEDMGGILNRYYDIQEELDPVGAEDSDVDNDGDSDESDDYLANRRDAVTKAVRKESVNEAKALSKMNTDELIKHWEKESKTVEMMKDKKQIDKTAYRVESGKIARILNYLGGLKKDMSGN
jgi:hypothetical protein